MGAEKYNRSWDYKANCANADPDLFFPEGKDSQNEAQIESAKLYCGNCEVANSCLLYALDDATHQEFGIWGGMTETERLIMRRRATHNLAKAARRSELMHRL